MRQPRWTIDETILAVDTYFEIGDVKKITKDNPLVRELSNTLRNMPIHKIKDEKFRNIAGICMTLLSIATLDDTAQYSMRAASKLQKEVYYYYKDRKRYLKEIASSIRSCLPLPFEYYEPVDHKPLLEGNILYLYHLFIENKSKEVQYLRKEFRNRKKTRCFVCGIDLENIYGCRGWELLELHYSDSIANYNSSMDILPGKFIPICPSCHKLSHSKAELFVLEKLKAIVLTGGTKNV
jgi:predicted HNH restriction endonuclease